jgi:hypothetical protein
MPNLDAPNGFVPVRHLKGGTVRYADGKYTIASGLASDIFLGDPVIHTGSGTNIDVAVGGPTSPSSHILGIFAGCAYTNAQGEPVWAKQWVSGTATLGAVDAEAFIYTDPDIVYSVQLGGSITAADIGQLADFLESPTGNTATGVSGAELEAVFAAGTQFKILRLAAAPDGIFEADISAANPRLEVIIADSGLAEAT